MSIETYARPASAAEAAALLAADQSAYAFAGGTDILVQQRARARVVSTLVDLKGIPGLLGVDWGSDSVRIGAATPGAELTADARLAELFPGLIEAIELIGSVQVQGRCSLGGNICNASPAADTTPALLASQARVQIFGPQGERELSIAELITGPGSTSLRQGEFLTTIELPLPEPDRADAALRLIPRTEMDIAAANAAVSLRLDGQGQIDGLRLAIGAVGPRALLVAAATEAMQGRVLDQQALDELAQLASAAAQPIDDKRGTVAFRRHVVGVLARRAAQCAQQRVEARR